ncbi:hypothetical protein ABS315_01525 [Peribacillus frigoritolerans]|uniref:hypothetical protein n=1 Tax=Peribacillus frigoritolerans TaxID=450367 RepID=UPI0021CEBCB8|nr:hypothetical protein [Peribacillus frigoritolerans]MCU6603594.1 hypothetical protein [Peribacillus frigoritolerans]UYY97002.1 hypothetical protein OJ967_16260 [Peribacillus frigoritolerans]
MELQTFYKDWVLLSYFADDSHVKLYVQSKQTSNHCPKHLLLVSTVDTGASFRA